MKDKAADTSKILVLTSTFPRWENDAEPAFIFELCHRLCPIYDVTVLSPRSPGSKKHENMAGVRVIRFPYFFQRWEKLAMHGGGILNKIRSNPLCYFMVPFFLLGQLWALIVLLRKEKFALIHAHWLIPQGLIAVLGIIVSRQKIPLVCTSHGGDLFGLQAAFFQRLKKWIINRSQALTVVSKAMQEYVVDKGVDLEKIRVISMGADLKNVFTPDYSVKRNTLELLFVGRLVEVKGVKILFEAISLLMGKKPEIRLVVAGAGPLERELLELAGRLRLSEKIDFLGMVTQSRLPELYRRATLAVFPFIVTESGVQEGFGLVVIEAMGCECPVIAGDIPSLRDSIIHEENGLVFAYGNSQALADTILRALNDQNLCSRIAKEARKRALEKYDWEIIVNKYSTLYEKLIKKEYHFNG